jgi:hypothetical protein
VPEILKHCSKHWKESMKEEVIFNFTLKYKFCQNTVFWQNFFIKHSI